MPVVLMLTAFGQGEARQRLADLDVHVDALLSKPVTPSTLFDACSAALGFAECRPTRIVLREEATLVHRARLRGARILLVEDHPINQELALDLLSRAGIVVSLASNGQEAIELMARQNVDAVLMDCQMPVMDGYAATRALRRQAQWRDLPVIAMTANAMVGDREKVLASGMNDHIAKPIKVDELFATLARWIRPVEPTAEATSELAAGAADVDSLAGFVGIDSRAGLAGMMGDEVLYCRLLRMFRDREARFPERFRAAWAEGDAAAAKRMVHDLKSVAGSLAVRGGYEAAAGLEQACDHGADKAGVEALLRIVDRSLAPVIAELRALGTEDAANLSEAGSPPARRPAKPSNSGR